MEMEIECEQQIHSIFRYKSKDCVAHDLGDKTRESRTPGQTELNNTDSLVIFGQPDPSAA